MGESPNSRTLSREVARKLRPGDDHYLAYVGPPTQYDFMGATQFRLLTSLGLREHNRVLDVGCGSLRAGRLLIPYLLPRHYFGLEPNQWLIDDAIENQVGRDMIRIKQPAFDNNNDFCSGVFGVKFDFIVAQSIFSHTGADLILKALSDFKMSLVPTGLILCTFVVALQTQPGANSSDWVYPGCISYSETDIADFFSRSGLAAFRLPWYHPRQAWFIAARNADDLPSADHLRMLEGAVLRDPEFTASLEIRLK